MKVIQSINDGSVNTCIGKCECGETQFEIKNLPIMRVICHCTICQEFNEAPFADISIFDKKDVDLPKDHTVNFKSYTKPPLVKRGKCSVCNKPAIEFLDIPVMQSLTIVPSANMSDWVYLPEPAFHSFYHRRVKDAQDTLPKYNSFLSSQTMFLMHLFKKRLAV